MAEMWTSKLGAKFLKRDIDAADAQNHIVLQKLRRLPENTNCADCDCRGTVWAIVNTGSFVCLRCASIHRSLGTHVSIPKGCTGTYLWGPDEIVVMKANGNLIANRRLGNPQSPLGASDEAMRRFLIEKYEKKRWAPAISEEAPALMPAEAPDLMPATTWAADLMTFDDAPAAHDFFANFGL